MEYYIRYFEKYPIPALCVLFTAVPIFFFLYSKEYKHNYFAPYFAFLVIKFIGDLVGLHLASHVQNNLWIDNSFVLIGTSAIMKCFHMKTEMEERKSMIKWIWIAFVLFYVVDMHYSNLNILDWHNHRSIRYSYTVECVIVILLCCMCFFEITRKLVVPDLLEYPFFYFCSGLLINAAGFVFISPMFYYWFTWGNRPDTGMFLNLPYIFEIFSFIIISVGLARSK